VKFVIGGSLLALLTLYLLAVRPAAHQGDRIPHPASRIPVQTSPRSFTSR